MFRPIKLLVPSVLIDFPTCLSTCVFVYLCALCSRRQDTSLARSRRARMAGKQGGWDVRVQCYEAKVSIFQGLLLHL